MMDFAQTALMWIVPFLIVLTVVVTIHELGHFLVARAFGTAVDRFSIGFGPKVLSWTNKRGMEWRLSAIPLGGYVKFSGDENAASVPDADDLDALRRQIVREKGEAAVGRYFHFKPLWQRALIVAAGPFANFLTAILIYSVFALAAGEFRTFGTRVGEITPGSAAAAGGFRVGDEVVKANGWRVYNFGELQRYVMMRAGEPIRFEVKRDGQPVRLTATPGRAAMVDPISGSQMSRGVLGLGVSTAPDNILTVRYGPIEAVGQGIRQTEESIRTSMVYIRRSLTGYENGNQISGPIGIAGASKTITTQLAAGAQSPAALFGQLGFGLLVLVAAISIAVGFANLLPIPVLDGGHLLFYGYEAVARRPLSARVQAVGYQVGFALLIGLVLFATWNDLQRYRVFQFIGGAFS